MNTRMEKYESNIDPKMSRTSRNSELYKTINKNEIDNYEIKSNATILGSNDKNQIDVEQVKKILDTRYKDMPKRKSIRLTTEEFVEEPTEEVTKEYDINAIIEKAKSDKSVSYEEERIKKLRDTQYDILNKLNVDKKDQIEKDETETRLLDLINTITINEVKNKEKREDPDLFSDLKGNDNTEVFEGMKEEIEKHINDDNSLSKTEEKTISLDNTNFTKSMEFSKKDFEDLDLDSEKSNVLTKIVIFIILVIFLVGVYFFLKAVFNF